MKLLPFYIFTLLCISKACVLQSYSLFQAIIFKRNQLTLITQIQSSSLKITIHQKRMFSNAYQNGTHVQVFDSKVNNEKNQFYKQLYRIQPNNIKKYFDKQVKSYLYEFQGLNARISFPSDDHKQLSLHQRFLVLQIHIPKGSSWSMQIAMTDISKTKRRINITTTQGKQQAKFFFLKYPVHNLEKGVWLFLGIDVLSFMEAFKGQVFRSLDHIVVGSNCRLRRIFTLKQWNQWDIPKSYWLPGEIQQAFQLIQYTQKKVQIGLSLSSPVQQQLSRIKQTPKKGQKQSKIRNSSINKSPTQNQQPYNQNGRKKESSIFQKSPDKYAINGTKSIINRNMTKSEVIPQLKSKVRLNTMEQNNDQRRVGKKSIQKQKSVSKSKAPLLQKSFQQDQALMAPVEQSDIPFVDSHESRQSQIIKHEVIEQDKWSDEDNPKTVSTPFTQQLNNMSGGFPTTTITKQNQDTVIVQKKEEENQLQLIYDEMVGCYYHPETNTYYQIGQ